MKTLKDQVKELTENQKHILEAIKYLNNRLDASIYKDDDEQVKDVKNIVERQAMIDKLIVKIMIFLMFEREDPLPLQPFQG